MESYASADDLDRSKIVVTEKKDVLGKIILKEYEDKERTIATGNEIEQTDYQYTTSKILGTNEYDFEIIPQEGDADESI